MFDIGFWELVLIGVVALVVLGPERLPTAARTAGLLLGKLRRTVTDVKAEIERELQVDEIRRISREQSEAVRESVNELREEVRLGQSSLDALKSSANKADTPDPTKHDS